MAHRCRRGASTPSPPGCIHHSDRGCQYASERYRNELEAAGLRGSMSAIGNPYHNAQAESFMKTLKVEEVLSLGIRNLYRCRRQVAKVHRGNLQYPKAPLRPWLSLTRGI